MTHPSQAWTPGQDLALEQTRRIADVGPAVRILAVHEPGPTTSALVLDLSLDCSAAVHRPGGVRLRRRERVLVSVPHAFPFAIPTVVTPHTRFAGTPHVQWGSTLCLYRSPSLEWSPSDGMFGFVERLNSWLTAAARGELDTPGEPLHPPVAYPAANPALLVVRADAPSATVTSPWQGAALMRRVGDRRADVIAWYAADARWPSDQAEARILANTFDDELFLAPAIVLARPLAFEYPTTAQELLASLADEGMRAAAVIELFGRVARANLDLLSHPAPTATGQPYQVPLHLLLGAPARGIAGSTDRITHLAAWTLPDLAEKVSRLAQNQHSTDPGLAELGREASDLGEEVLDMVKTQWAYINEARPQTTVRRDAATPASWLTGRRILVMGAGALGAPIAEWCVRAGAAAVTVADKSLVHPGILVRQPYADADIGKSKAWTLANRLRRVRPDAVVQPVVGDVTDSILSAGVPTFDLIVDATADRTVRLLLEQHRAAAPGAWPPVATLLLGHQATRGLAALSPSVATGGGTDILRRLARTTYADLTGELADIADDFFPTAPRTDLFQPEPGCSDATFVGSAVDVAALAGQLFTGILQALQRPADQQMMTALIVRTPSLDPTAPPARTCWFTWPDDTVLTDSVTGYQVRLSPAATTEMHTEARRGARLRGPRVETGGTLLGAIDDAARIIWVDEATGPPPDSLLSEAHFQHGTKGVGHHLEARRIATAGITRFLGMWHTHPYGPAQPSPTDEAGMRHLVLPTDNAPPRALILIAGGDTWDNWIRGTGQPRWYTRLVTRPPGQAATPPQPRRRTVNLHTPQTTWWPGGYASTPLRKIEP
ncbi:ThiF family adenylyltransferase [Kitasatospora sp. NBC_01539]|uniref:ThiF family adenylyltransferase n=1 Tax=Kitasatospora sp. NBC_01539 TaxID=2903577 RepID=UPI0038602FB6